MAEWQNNGSWKEWFEITGADGVDFVPLFFTGEELIYESFTKEDFFKTNYYPKTGYKFWKIINGSKFYIDLTSAPKQKEKIHIIEIDAPVEYVVGHLCYGHFEGKIELNEEDYQLFIKDPSNFLYDFDYLDELDFIIDDYDIDDRGPIESVDWKEL